MILEYARQLVLHFRGALVPDDRRSNLLQKLLRAVDDDLGRAWSCAVTLLERCLSGQELG